MLRRFVLAAAVLLIASVSAWAQGFAVLFLYLSEDGLPLTTTCNGSTPIPDGRTIKIFWDVDSDGPDLTDPQPTVCDVPPECDTGPVGTVNYNAFSFNGTAMGRGAGYFEPAALFVQSLDMPNPPRFYLRVYESDGVTLLWTSAVKIVVSGVQDIHFPRNEWTCGTGGPQCLVRDEHE
jgi:hypothetical protein